MDLLEKIKDLQMDIQVVGCGENIIPFVHKIFENDPTHHKCLAKIMGKQKTMSSIILDCYFTNPKVYVPDYFEVSIQKYMNNDTIYMVLNLVLCNVYEKNGHSNALVINKNLKSVERFEPKGKNKNKYYDDLPIENAIKNFVETYFVGFTYLSPYVFIGDKGPQTHVKLDLNFDFGRGLCVNYTILYIYLRCKENLGPNETIEFMNAHFLNTNILKFTNFVNSYLL